MDAFDITRRASLDLIHADLSNPADITALLASHVVAPARALFGLEAPRPGERRAAELPRGMIRLEPDPAASIALFVPFIRGYVLLARLFPSAIAPSDLDRALESPEQAHFGASRAVAAMTWDDLAWLADGVCGAAESPRPLGAPEIVPARHDGDGNAHARAVLRDAQALLRAALGPIEWSESLRPVDIGLQAVDAATARAIDAILRASARERLVSFGDAEYDYYPSADGWVSTPTWFDRGVFAAVLPETAEAVFALDFVETLRSDRMTGLCALCARPLLLTSQQAARASRGRPVYHPGCHDEHRRRYVRDFQRAWTRERRAAGPDA